MQISIDQLKNFLSQCHENNQHFDQIIVPTVLESGKRAFKKFTPESEIDLDSYRTVDPLKFLFYFPRETVYPEQTQVPRRLIVGAKSCDLKALQILDLAMHNEDFVDPVYVAWREATTIVSSDCLSVGPTCHCTLVAGKPYAETGFDLNLARLGDQYHITVGSEKGEKLLALFQARANLEEMPVTIKEQLAVQRQTMTEEIERQNQDFARDANYSTLQTEGEGWQEESLTCVGCGGCTNICPTCYCLILNDESKAEKFIKVRSYDSCQYNGYARVAGGGTPRPKMFQRFRNRYLCKFLYMDANFNALGCTGCGRCTDTCPGQIDFRKVVKRIMHEHAS